MVLRMLSKISFSDRTKEFLHNFIMLTELSSGPWALFTFKTCKNMSNLLRSYFKFV